MKNTLILILILGLTLAACSAGQGNTLIGTWKLISYGDSTSQKPAFNGFEATITFNTDGTVGGNFGCNSFGGDYTATRSKIEFNPITSTLMACSQEELMTQEGEALAILNGSVDYTIENGALTIRNADGGMLVLEAVK